jgi:hypothetical protein
LKRLIVFSKRICPIGQLLKGQMTRNFLPPKLLSHITIVLWTIDMKKIDPLNIYQLEEMLKNRVFVPWFSFGKNSIFQNFSNLTEFVHSGFFDIGTRI